MLNISELHEASLIMDIAAVFLLIGTIIYTTIYRKRGHIDDKLFFYLIVDTLVMAISDGITYVLDGGSVPYGALISLVCNYIFFISFELFCGLLAVYLDYRVYQNVDALKKRGTVLMIPAVIMMVMIIANIFGRFLFWVDPQTSEYIQYPAYSLIFVAPAIYVILGIFYCFKLDFAMMWIFVLLLLVRLFFGNLMRGVSSTSLIFSMVLVFIHIHYMRLPFYDDEEAL